MLATNFASRTFAYRCLAQGLSTSVSSFMREYPEEAIKTDQRVQYVDDIDIAGNDSKTGMCHYQDCFWMHPKCRIETQCPRAVSE